MSLKPFFACVVPERTASVARLAFPVGSLCIRILDELGTIFQDQDFADLYSQHGQPGQPPFRLALAQVCSLPKELYEALRQNRRRENAEEFKEEYRNRAGIERTIIIINTGIWLTAFAISSTLSLWENRTHSVNLEST